MSSIGFLDQAVSLHGLQHQFTVMMKEIRKYGMVCPSLPMHMPLLSFEKKKIILHLFGIYTPY